MHSSPHRKCQKCAACVLIHPEYTHTQMSSCVFCSNYSLTNKEWMQLPNSVKQLQPNYIFKGFRLLINKSCTMIKKKTTTKNTTIHEIQRTNTKFLSVIIIVVFPYLTSTDNTVITSHSIPKESKGLISFLTYRPTLSVLHGSMQLMILKREVFCCVRTV